MHHSAALRVVRPWAASALVVWCVVVVAPRPAASLSNGVGRTPIMGWMTWQRCVHTRVCETWPCRNVVIVGVCLAQRLLHAVHCMLYTQPLHGCSVLHTHTHNHTQPPPQSQLPRSITAGSDVTARPPDAGVLVLPADKCHMNNLATGTWIGDSNAATDLGAG
jgi:hypothetical protein